MSWVKSRVESQKMDPINIRSTHILFVSWQSGIPFLSFDFFKIWPWKSRVKGMSQATIQSNNNNNNLYWHKYRSSTSWLNSILQYTVSLELSQLWLYALYSRLRIINAWGETKSQCGSNILSQWAWRHLKSPASWLFTQAHIQVKENFKAPRHWPLWGEFTGDRWIPHTKGQ